MLKVCPSKYLAFFLFVYPITSPGFPGHCVREAKYLIGNNQYIPISQLPLSDLKHALRDYISRGKIEYSNHALQRMEKRMISKEEVEYVLRKARQVVKDPYEVNGYTISGLTGHTYNRGKLRVALVFKDYETLTITTVWRP